MIAVRGTALAAGQRRFRIRGTQAAGAPATRLDADDACVEIMTGAMLPADADTIVPVERIAVTDGWAALEDGYQPQPNQFVHKRASDHAGCCQRDSHAFGHGRCVRHTGNGREICRSIHSRRAAYLDAAADRHPDAAAHCDAAGQQMVPSPCEASTPYCVQSGLCVECTGPEHCPLSASECLVAVCNDNACAFEPVQAGVACGVGGTCDGNGLCTYCVPGQKACSGTGAPMECDAQGQWVNLPACASPTPYCKEGVCVQCQSVYQCPASGNECMSAACSAAGSCGFTAKIATTPCSDERQCDGMGACLCETGAKSCQGITPRTCSAAGAWVTGLACSGSTPACVDGACVECAASYDCPTASVCMTAICASSECSEMPSPPGTPCVGGICDGQGVCNEGGGGTGGGAGGGSYAPSYLEGNAVPVKCGPRQIRLFGHCFP